MEEVDGSDGKQVNPPISDAEFIRLIERTLTTITSQPLPEKLTCGIDNTTYLRMASVELECLKLLLSANGLVIEITQEDDNFRFTLYRDDGSASGRDKLGDTTCVIMGHSALTAFKVRSANKKYKVLEDAEIPVVKMEFTRLRVNGFKGAEIIQRYIMCLCAMGGVHIMIKDIMTDLAGFIKDWNNNIGCFPEDVALSRTKFVDSFDSWASQSNSDTCSSSANVSTLTSSFSSDTSSSNNSSSYSSQDPYNVQESQQESQDNACNATYIPDINREQAKELINYFVFQYNDEIQQLLTQIKKSQVGSSEYNFFQGELQRLIEETRTRVRDTTETFADDMYSQYYSNNDEHNRNVDIKKDAAKQELQSQLANILSGIEYTYLTPSGEMPDYDSSPEAMLIINKLFETDLSDDNFKNNLIDIATRIQRKFPTGLNMNTFGSGVDNILRELNKRTARAADEGSSGAMVSKTTPQILRSNSLPQLRSDTKLNSYLETEDDAYISPNPRQAKMQKTAKPNFIGARLFGKKGGNPTKKTKNKNTRASKRKKNKKRAIKTQKKKRNKTRK